MYRCPFIVLAAAVLGGCSSSDAPPTSQPAAVSQPVAPPTASAPTAEPSPLVAGYEQWDAATAEARLGEAETRLSAAIRLVQMSELYPACVPAPLSDAWVRRLRLVQLFPEVYAVGVDTPDEPARLRMPVILRSGGAVETPLVGVEEEASVLWVADDPEVFPHLLVAPQQILIVRADETIAAVVGKDLRGLRFAPREDDGYRYVALINDPVGAAGGNDPDPPGEVARYNWEPFEETFLGPARDKIAPDAGDDEVFAIDLEASQRLVPVGGIIPPPTENTPPPAEDPNDLPPPF